MPYLPTCPTTSGKPSTTRSRTASATPARSPSSSTPTRWGRGSTSPPNPSVTTPTGRSTTPHRSDGRQPDRGRPDAPRRRPHAPPRPHRGRVRRMGGRRPLLVVRPPGRDLPSHRRRRGRGPDPPGRPRRPPRAALQLGAAPRRVVVARRVGTGEPRRGRLAPELGKLRRRGDRAGSRYRVRRVGVPELRAVRARGGVHPRGRRLAGGGGVRAQGNRHPRRPQTRPRVRVGRPQTVRGHGPVPRP